MIIKGFASKLRELSSPWHFVIFRHVQYSFHHFHRTIVSGFYNYCLSFVMLSHYMAINSMTSLSLSQLDFKILNGEIQEKSSQIKREDLTCML